MCDFCKPFGIWEYRLDKLAKEVDICFREKKMGKTKGRSCQTSELDEEGEYMQRDRGLAKHLAGGAAPLTRRRRIEKGHG